MDYTIQHGIVIDGTGVAHVAADVLLRDGKIAEVAVHLPSDGRPVIAAGRSTGERQGQMLQHQG